MKTRLKLKQSSNLNDFAIAWIGPGRLFFGGQIPAGLGRVGDIKAVPIA